MAKPTPNVITNVSLLQAAIDESGLSPTALAAAWGMSIPTYYSRKSGQSEFTASEIVAATVSLKLTRNRRDQIFLGASVN